MRNVTREIYWNISGVWIMYILLVPTLAAFGYGIYRRYRIWAGLGKKVDRLDQPRERLRRVWTFVMAHKRFFRDGVAGRMHAMIFWSMLLLLIGTTVVAIDADFHIPIMRGWFYLIFQKLILTFAGAFLLVGSLVGAYRRYIARVARLQNNREGVPRDPSDGPSLGFMVLLMAQGFALQAIRLAAQHDPYELWSPLGYVLSLPLRGVSPALLISLYQGTWWFHLATAFGWIAWVPYSKMLHIFTGTAGVYASNLQPAGVGTILPMNFEDVERLGASALTDFTWKDLLDLDACTACGRCQAVCPAYSAGLPLSPKNLILDLRDHMTRTSLGTAGDEVMVGGVIMEETLWACTTCRACMEECPILIEHVPKIVEMRRHLVMEQASMPDTLADAMKSLDDRVHPYKGASAGRTDWCEGMDVPIAAEKAQVDVLYWVGCTSAFDARNQKVARAFATLMNEAGVDFAILGNEEACCGDPARRAGNEFSFDTVARGNIETLKQYNPKKIVTTCPHCFNAIGSEYRALGGEFEVMHHTQLLKELVDAGKLKVSSRGKDAITYHDPCYLGRWGGEYEAPRALAELTGELKEMERSRSKSFCCGAGGGHAWMEEHGDGPRINQIRAKEAIGTGAATVAVSCPFCVQMMEDGVKSIAGDEGPRVRDIAELLLEAALETGPHKVQ